jgi:FtsP/CotA-like multicopper oxidase with cupredoxin domain
VAIAGLLSALAGLRLARAGDAVAGAEADDPYDPGAPHGAHGVDPVAMEHRSGTTGPPADAGYDPVGTYETGHDAALHPPPPSTPGDGPKEIHLEVAERRIQIAPGVRFDAWTYNGTVPGPIVRATEGETLEIRLVNRGTHPHTVHFHGSHDPSVDGVFQIVEPGASLTYLHGAGPAGVHLYHCHAPPLAEHIARGLYGLFIVDPREGRPLAQELALVLSAFDTDGDGRNEIYAFNGRAFAYDRQPIVVSRDLPVRVYLANLTEHDPVNSFHLHGEVFKLYRTGTTRTYELTDTVTLGQGERCLLEIEFQRSGMYMFHSHQSRFAERGAMGWFYVLEPGENPALAALYARTVGRCDPCEGTLGAKPIVKY